MKFLPSLLLLAAVLVAPVHAASEVVARAIPESLSATSPCRTLMTELECSLHKTKLAQLGKGPALERYLAEHASLMQERDAACSCNRKVVAETIYPARRQALLRF